MEISVIVPVRNEEETVEYNLSRLAKFLIENEVKAQLLVVNDRSVDKTCEILKELQKKYKFIEIVNRTGDPKPVELGYALREGLGLAKYEATTFFMGDSTDCPNDLLKMLEAFNRGYDTVVGSRFIKGSMTQGYPKRLILFNRLFNLFVKMLFLLKTNDLTYSFKVYKTKLLKEISIESKGFEVFVEVPLKILKQGHSYIQIPIGWNPREKGKSSFRFWDNGRKYVLTCLKILFQDP